MGNIIWFLLRNDIALIQGYTIRILTYLFSIDIKSLILLWLIINEILCRHNIYAFTYINCFDGIKNQFWIMYE